MDCASARFPIPRLELLYSGGRMGSVESSIRRFPTKCSAIGFILLTSRSTSGLLAAGPPMKMRDYVDLRALDRHVMPLWRMACDSEAHGPDAS